MNARLSVKVQPRASRDEVVCLQNGSWKIRLTAPPVENAANKALIDFLSRVLRVRKGDLSIVSGEKGRNKRIAVSGRSQAEVEQHLGRAAKAVTSSE